MKKKWLSLLLSVSMLAGSLSPAVSVHGEEMFSDMGGVMEEAIMPEEAFVPEEETVPEEVFGDSNVEAEPEEFFMDETMGEAEARIPEAEAAMGKELPSYIFGAAWNKTYDVLYYEAGRDYAYNGEAVTFPDENTVLVGETSYPIRNKETTVNVSVDEENKVTVSLTGLGRPVVGISGAWNSNSGGKTFITYATDIPDMENVSSNPASPHDLTKPVVLEDVPAGTWNLTYGGIYEEANSYSPGYNFGDGNGVVKKRVFGYLPEVTFTVEEAEKPDEPEADVYLGVNAGSEVPESFTNDVWVQYDFKELAVGENATLTPRRVPEAITHDINNDLELPHFNYKIIKGDSVIIDESNNAHAKITAVKEGNTVVQVTYDEYTHSQGKYFPASDPVNTAYVIYSVGGNAGISITDNLGDFRSYDTLYFTSGEAVSYTMKAAAEGAESLTVKCNGITVTGEAGSYVLPLENRSNIIELTAKAADGTARSRFHVLDARKIKIHAENKTHPGTELHKGETATISFTGITMPVYKVATIYNPQYASFWGGGPTNVHYDCGGQTYRGKCKQWDLAEKNSFDVKLDKTGGITFTNGGIQSNWWGDPIGSDKIKDEMGDANTNADEHTGEFSMLPNFTLEVAAPVPVEEITLNQTELKLDANETAELKAVVTPDEATFKEISWTSDNTEIAEVSENGAVTAVANGKTLIRATADGKEAVCRVTVTKPDIEGIAFAEEKTELFAGNTKKLSVVFTPSSIREERVVFSSSDENIASVDREGVVTANKVGTAEITAASYLFPEIKAVCTVEVMATVPESMELDAEEMELTEGTSKTLKAVLLPEEAQETAVIKWTSSDETVAAVTEKGIVTALKEGTCTVKAQVAGTDTEASCIVTVTKAELLEVEAVVSPAQVYDGDSVTVTLKGFTKPEKIGTKKIWSQTFYYDTTIPGKATVSGGSADAAEFSFTVPAGTPSGTYYLTNGRYWAEYGGMILQGMPMYTTKETFCEGQMPMMVLKVTNRAEEEQNRRHLREDAIDELEGFADLSKYREEQQELIKEILAASKESIEFLNEAEDIQQVVAQAKKQISSIKTSNQVLFEELSALKKQAREELDSYKNLKDYREAQKQQLALMIVTAKLEVIDAASAEEIQKIVTAAKEKMDQVKTDKELTAEEESQITPTPTPTPEEKPTEPSQPSVVLKKGNVYTVGNLKYRITSLTKSGNGTVALAGTTTAKAKLTTLNVGNTVKIGDGTFTVTSIGIRAFKNYTKLTNVTLGGYIKYFGWESFSGCKNLKSIKMTSKKFTSVHKNAIKNIHPKAVIDVKNDKVKAYKKLFKSSTGYKKTMKIK